MFPWPLWRHRKSLGSVEALRLVGAEHGASAAFAKRSPLGGPLTRSMEGLPDGRFAELGLTTADAEEEGGRIAAVHAGGGSAADALALPSPSRIPRAAPTAWTLPRAPTPRCALVGVAGACSCCAGCLAGVQRLTLRARRCPPQRSRIPRPGFEA